MKQKAKDASIQFIKYGLVGISNTLITLVVFYLMNTILGLPYGISNTVGYIIGLINSFIWNRRWVFKSDTHLKQEILMFSIGFLLCFGLQMLMSWMLLEPMGMKEMEISWLPMKKPGQNVVMIVSMGVYTVANFVYNRYFTFKHNSTSK